MPGQPRMKIIYSSIWNRGITLVSHQEGDLDICEYLPELRQAIKNLDTSSHEQELIFSFEVQPTVREKAQAYFLIDRGIVFVCMVENAEADTLPVLLPYAFLKNVREKFSEQPSLISRSYRAGEDEFDRDFRPVLIQIMDDFNSGKADKISQVQDQIEDVRQVMLRNIDKIVERGEMLDDLLSKAEELESQGQDFRFQARQVFVQARCRNLKLWLVIGVLFSVFLTIVILFVTGVIKT